MIKILFVCHGNICRSPMAEYVFKDIVIKNGEGNDFEVSSCATSQEEIGNPIYPPIKKILEKQGIACDDKRARQFQIDDYAYYDMIIVMDEYNKHNLLRMCQQDPQNKVSLLLDYSDRKGQAISDPWYTRKFDKCYEDILYGCESLYKKVKLQ